MRKLTPVTTSAITALSGSTANPTSIVSFPNPIQVNRESETKRVRVRVVREEPNVVAEIADTGVGMDEERLAGAFDLFYSTKDMSAEGEGGTGLGLAIAHQIVTDHGGEIELDHTGQRVEGGTAGDVVGEEQVAASWDKQA